MKSAANCATNNASYITLHYITLHYITDCQTKRQSEVVGLSRRAAIYLFIYHKIVHKVHNKI